MSKHEQEKWFKAEDKVPFDFKDNVGAMPTHQRYVDRYNEAKLKPNSGLGIQVICDKIQKNKERYVTIEKLTGVPWFFIGALHAMESSLDFNAWLANGDPLSAPTRNDPHGLKLTGKHSDKFVDGAVVSLEHEGFDGLKFNDIGDILIAAESYNGLGYLTGAGRATTPPETSPYLWSGTDQYVRGKYVSDGLFDADAVSGQAGVVGIFKELQARGELKFSGSKDEPKPKPQDEDVTWIKFFRDGFVNTIIGYAGDKAKAKLNSSDKKELISFLEKHTKANTFHVALPGEAIPNLNETPNPTPSEGKSFMVCTKAQQNRRPDGMVPLNLTVYDRSGMKKATFRCVSGLPDKQNFFTGAGRRASTAEPCPEGLYLLSDIDWAGGKDNYDVFHNEGIGPLCNDLFPQFETQGTFFLIHGDFNVLGTLGCIGIEGFNDSSRSQELRKYVQVLRAHDPREVYVDWGLGTCPATPKING